MKLGIFSMPSHPPERSLKDGHEWDLQNIIWADELGFEEFWIGEHHAMVWEPHPSPDLLVVEGFRQTKNIRIGPGGFCLPYHHPAELANRIAMLDHLSGGRLNVGFAASGSPTDWEMFQVDGFAVIVRDDAVVNLWGASDEAWRERDDLAARPVCSGAESFLAGTASCRIEVDDVDALFEELQAADVLHPVSRDGVTTTDFGTREFATLDLDGNLLSFFRWEAA